MPDGWSRPCDVELLADRRSDIEFAIPLSRLPRVSQTLTSAEGLASGHVRFGRRGRYATAALEVQATLTLTCQRCLAPMAWPVETDAEVAFVAETDDGGDLPPELDPVVADEGRVTVAWLVDEELLLALPIVALHADPAECAATGRTDDPAGGEEPAEKTQRPFADLGELLKRGS